ncbi:MAG TPA: DNA primase small subunit domain-containing protein, partial [Ornithinimicrobium sp.]|uniref:non-homologous end-joining DNA ligase LigD n=1 Tax=Ornithinimicrobium sp. TaxID=1977084 RepID=UPI002B4A3E3D
DLDPGDDCSFATVREVAGVVKGVLGELGATGWPKTTGGSGLHVYVRIQPDHGFTDVRRAALAFAREVERRSPGQATTTWWRKDRDPRAVFVDFNQNARDHTIACAYSVRGTPDARVSAPLAWEEVADCEPGAFTVASMPERFTRLGDLHADIDQHPFDIAELLRWAERDEADGLDTPQE